MAETVINGVRIPFLPVNGVEDLKRQSPIELPEGPSFKSVFQKELGQLHFSKHAQERLDARNIHLNESDLSQLQRAVAKAEEKGAQESLVLLPAQRHSGGMDVAFIVNVKNRMVVTAIDGERLRENVFTNIDSAVIAA